MKKKLVLCSLLSGLVCLFVYSTTHADSFDNWVWRSGLPQGNTLRAVTFGNDLFVAVGDGGTIMVSSDASTWKCVRSGMPETLNGVAWGNGYYVAVGKSGFIITSTDGISWTSINSGTQKDLYAVAFGAGAFIAVGGTGADSAHADGIILKSSDSTAWSQLGPFSNCEFHAVTFANNHFYAAGYQHTVPIPMQPEMYSDWVYKSADGNQWSAAYQAPRGFAALYGIAGNDSGVVAVGESVIFKETVLAYANGAWSAVQAPSEFVSFSGVVYAQGKYLAVGAYSGNERIATSSDGLAWAVKWSGSNAMLNAVAYGKDTFVAVGEGGIIVTSPDSETWTKATEGQTAWFNNVAYGNGLFVAVGSHKKVATSTDGITWTERMSAPNPSDWSSNCAPTFYDVIYAKGLFVVVGANTWCSQEEGMILTSVNGIDWTQRVTSTRLIAGVAYGNNTFVAIGDGLFTSTDGTNWDKIWEGASHVSSPYNARGVIFGNEVFVAPVSTSWLSNVPESSSVLLSSDGKTWSPQAIASPNVIGYVNGVFLGVGASRLNIYTSTDGTTWQMTGALPSCGTSCTNQVTNRVVFIEGNYVAVGDTGNIFTSTDAVNWTRQPYSSKNPNVNDLKGIAYGNGRFTIVGDRGTVLQSAGGGVSALALSAGWNFISLPLTPPDPTIGQVLAPVSSKTGVVWGYDNETKAWKKWTPAGGAGNTLLALEAGKGYWISMSSATSLDMSGWSVLIAPSVTLSAGWNLVGYAGIDGVTPASSLAPLSNKWSVLWTWDNNQWYGKHATIATLASPIQPLSVFSQKKAFWIKMALGSTMNWAQ